MEYFKMESVTVEVLYIYHFLYMNLIYFKISPSITYTQFRNILESYF